MWIHYKSEAAPQIDVASPQQSTTPQNALVQARRHNHICRFFLPLHRFGVASPDCKLSWQSDMFLLHMKVGVPPTVWQVLTNFWQSVVNFPKPGTRGLRRPLSATHQSHLLFSQLQPWLQIFTCVKWRVSFFQPGLSLNQHKWYVWWKYTYLGFWEWQWNGVHFKIDFVNIWPNLGRNPAETFQEDDYHIFGLAVLDDHEWMVLRRIGNESGTELGWGLAGK